jgi:Yip1-like protein
MGPSLKDLLAILIHPRETMRRILDSGAHRWAVEIVILASICSAIGDSDLRELNRALPDLMLMPVLALVVLTLAVTALVWVALLYLFAWPVTLVGRRLEGQAPVADVRAALAWSIVPVIWSVIARIPIAVYRQRFLLHGNSGRVLTSFIEQGGCAFAIVLLTVQTIVIAAVVALSGFCVAEALKVPTWKGFAAVGITAVIPVIVGVAALLAVKT